MISSFYDTFLLLVRLDSQVLFAHFLMWTTQFESECSLSVRAVLGAAYKDLLHVPPGMFVAIEWEESSVMPETDSW